MAIHHLSVAELASQIAQRRLSPVEVTQAYLHRIRGLDWKLKAFVEVYEDALEQAASCERRLHSGMPLGPLHGVPVALKDLIDIEGRVTTAGSPVHRDRIATQTATVAQRLLAAGAVIIGKAHLVEFAYGGWGTNRGMGTPWNPWDPSTRRTPGGSSSGSAVAVAGGLAPAALGTDTGGSVRIPSSFCGLTGLKVTQGRISNHGLRLVSRTLDTVGPMTRTAEDAAILMQVIHGPDVNDPATLAVDPEDFLRQLAQPIDGIRIGIADPGSLGPVDDCILAAVEAGCRALEKRGAVRRPVAKTIDFQDDQSETGIIISTEAFAASGDAAERDDIPGDAPARARVLGGREIPGWRYHQALVRREERRRDFLSVFAHVDVLALPTTPNRAIPVQEVDEGDLRASRLTRFVGYYGLCAIALPCGIGPDGMPISLQLVAAPYKEGLLLRLGHAFQQATDHHERHAPDHDMKT